MGIRLDPESLYSEQHLRLWGLDGDVLARARKRGELPCRDLGHGLRMYLGRELLAWIERHRTPAAGEVPA